MNLSTVKWAQWDKNPIQRTVSLFICVCIALCTMLHTILHRTDLIVSSLTLQTITTAPMMSIWGKGGPGCREHQSVDIVISNGACVLCRNFTKCRPTFKISLSLLLDLALSKLVMNSSLKVPSHIKRVATLPCKIPVVVVGNFFYSQWLNTRIFCAILFEDCLVNTSYITPDICRVCKQET